MSTKSNTIKHVVLQGRDEKMNRLEALVREVEDEDVLRVFAALAMRNAQGNEKMEETLYSMDFLNMMKDTIIKTLSQYLEKTGAQEEVMNLFAELCSLTACIAEASEGHGYVPARFNHLLSRNIESATHDIVKVGGSFYSPYNN